jgi:hypothetical protein
MLSSRRAYSNGTQGMHWGDLHIDIMKKHPNNWLTNTTLERNHITWGPTKQIWLLPCHCRLGPEGKTHSFTTDLWLGPNHAKNDNCYNWLNWQRPVCLMAWATNTTRPSWKNIWYYVGRKSWTTCIDNVKFLRALWGLDPHPSKSKLWTGLKQVKKHRILTRIVPDWIFCSRKFETRHSRRNLRHAA